MAFPIDVRDLLKSSTQLAEERDRPVRLAVFVEPDAPLAVLDVLEDRLRHATRNARLRLDLLEPGFVPVVDAAADAVAVLVGSGGAAAQDALRAPLKEGVPVALLATDPIGETVGRRSGVPSADVLVHHDPEHLVDERLGEWLIERLPAKRLALAHNFPFVRRQVAEEAVKATAWQNAMIGVVAIIPGADMPLMTANQAKMLLQIAAAYGETLGADRVKELAVVVGGGFAFRAVARQGLTLLPGFGWVLKGGVGFAGTVAMGRAAIEYFESGADLSGVTERLRELREEAGRRAGGLRERLRPAPGTLAEGDPESGPRAELPAANDRSPAVE